MTPLMAINYIRKSVGYNAYLAEYARFRKIQEEEFTQVLEELQESAKGYDTYEAWFDHIKEYTEELNRQSKENQKEKEGVVVSTMHSTKGLEFERVFLPDVNEDVIPHKKSMKEEDVEEERRLFYVGVTRAKKYLHILSVKKLYNKDSRPSRFVEELRSRQEKEVFCMENRAMPRAKANFICIFKRKTLSDHYGCNTYRDRRTIGGLSGNV